MPTNETAGIHRRCGGAIEASLKRTFKGGMFVYCRLPRRRSRGGWPGTGGRSSRSGCPPSGRCGPPCCGSRSEGPPRRVQVEEGMPFFVQLEAADQVEAAARRWRRRRRGSAFGGCGWRAAALRRGGRRRRLPHRTIGPCPPLPSIRHSVSAMEEPLQKSPSD